MEVPDESLLPPDYAVEKQQPCWQDWRWHLRHPWVPRGFGGLPARVTPYYADLLRSLGPGHPLFRTVVPTEAERICGPGEQQDPLAEDACSPVPGLVHRYPDRCLLLVSNACALYCRYCTRSRAVGHGAAADLDQAFQYLRQHPEIRDVVVSGGDPLLLEVEDLDYILGQLTRIPSIEMVRIGTKIPMVLPCRLDRDLLAVLRRYHPWVSVHCTHPDELTPEACEALEEIASCGCPVGSQTVLLKGINDDPDVMLRLVRGLTAARVRPYYLYQCDPVIGTSGFRTDPRVGVEIVGYLRGRVSGYAIPTFVIDAPGGGGKIPLAHQHGVEWHDDSVSLQNWTGQTFHYPLT